MLLVFPFRTLAPEVSPGLHRSKKEAAYSGTILRGLPRFRAIGIAAPGSACLGLPRPTNGSASVPIIRTFHEEKLKQHVHESVRKHVFENPMHFTGKQGEPGERGPEGLLGEPGKAPTPDELKALMREGLKDGDYRYRREPGASSIPGPVGPQGAPGHTPSKHELDVLIRAVLAEGSYRGEPGPQGEPGRDSKVPGPQRPAGKDGVSVTGPQGPQGEPGRDGKDAVLETIVAVLNSQVSHQIVAAQIAAIRQELNVIDQLADTRPLLPPIYSDMTNRVRHLIR